MLFIDSREIELILVKDGVACSCCRERPSSYKMESLAGGERRPFCGWCVLYGDTKWGEENRDELAWSGRYVRQEAIRSQSRRVLVPYLDEQGRMKPEDAERYVMGILFTSKLLERGRALVGKAHDGGAKVIRLFADSSLKFK